jgi:CubicO group peptidase (beta-lactamase class C family)
MSGRIKGARFLLIAGAIVDLLSPPAAAETAAVACGAPLQVSQDWQTATSVEANLDEQVLCSLNQKLDASPEMRIHAVVVLRGGKLVFETYRKGDDENWDTKLEQVAFTPETLHDVRSVSKSVVSLLIGIAIDRKLIASVDEPVLSFFPEYADLRTPETDRIQLRHLLTMTAGLHANEEISYESPLNTERLIYESADPYRTVIELGVRHPPGEIWHYNSGCTMLLSAVLQKVTGKELPDFAREALFEPLGITDFYWTTVAPSGEAAAGAGLRLRPRDMAKVGQLLLNRGVWNGRRVVSTDWLDASVQQLYRGWLGNGYGLHWWIGQSRVGERDFSWIAGWGYGGQRVFVVPEADVVVAINAGLYEADDPFVPLSILEEFVLAAVRD